MKNLNYYRYNLSVTVVTPREDEMGLPCLMFFLAQREKKLHNLINLMRDSDSVKDRARLAYQIWTGYRKTLTNEKKGKSRMFFNDLTRLVSHLFKKD